MFVADRDAHRNAAQIPLAAHLDRLLQQRLHRHTLARNGARLRRHAALCWRLFHFGAHADAQPVQGEKGRLVCSVCVCVYVCVCVSGLSVLAGHLVYFGCIFCRSSCDAEPPCGLGGCRMSAPRLLPSVVISDRIREACFFLYSLFGSADLCCVVYF